ncbi:MBL fold metallo-hydrolase [Acidianus brierleyi]|uniref:Hydrolase n=1 Tax=Acidianus brierleyi TaxID=41673 RepID=A0A2U9IBG6_9CREN|nr:MBL fold metallo-hydrolase [Acidianus brierleyi]AWR93350.1 hydrolase [Acidianus brierleyi]
MIKYFGHSMFSIDDKILIDPHDGGSIGLTKPNVEYTDLVLITHDHYDHNAYQLLKFKEIKQSFYGNYTFEGYKILGLRAFHDKENGKRRGETAIYRIDTGKSIIVHLGDVCDKLSEKIIKEISSPDILMIPIGGLITIDYKEAIDLINDLKPSTVIPMHYWVNGHLMPLDPPDEFLRKMGWKIRELNKNYFEDIEKGEIIYFKA